MSSNDGLTSNINQRYANDKDAVRGFRELFGPGGELNFEPEVELEQRYTMTTRITEDGTIEYSPPASFIEETRKAENAEFHERGIGRLVARLRAEETDDEARTRMAGSP